MKEKAGEAAEAGKQAAGQVAQTAADKAKDVAQETSRQARDLLGEARGQMQQQAGSQHRALVANLRSLADELGAMSAGNQSPGMATELVGQARERTNAAADWLAARQPGDLVEEVRSFARQRPAAFLLGAAAAGVLAGRLTRGTIAAHREDSNSSSDEYPQGAISAPAYPTDAVSGTGYPTDAVSGTGYPTDAVSDPGYPAGGYPTAAYPTGESSNSAYPTGEGSNSAYRTDGSSL